MLLCILCTVHKIEFLKVKSASLQNLSFLSSHVVEKTAFSPEFLSSYWVLWVPREQQCWKDTWVTSEFSSLTQLENLQLLQQRSGQLEKPPTSSTELELVSLKTLQLFQQRVGHNPVFWVIEQHRYYTCLECEMVKSEPAGNTESSMVHAGKRNLWAPWENHNLTLVQVQLQEVGFGKVVR